MGSPELTKMADFVGCRPGARDRRSDRGHGCGCDPRSGWPGLGPRPGYSPLVTGVAFLPISGGLVVMANLSTIVLVPRFGPKPLVALGMLAASGGAAWLAQLGPHTVYATGVLGPLILAGIGMGMVIAPMINTGTFGVAPQEASATVTVGQMLGGSVGNRAAEHHLRRRGHFLYRRASRRGPDHRPPGPAGLALAHGYDTAFWSIAGIFAGGAVIGGVLLRRAGRWARSARRPRHLAR